MAETKTIGTLKVVLDSDNAYDFIGEVQGGFDEQALQHHIANYGVNGLLETLNYMNWQVRDAMYKSRVDHEKFCTDGLPHEFVTEFENTTAGGNCFGRCKRCGQMSGVQLKPGGQSYKEELLSAPKIASKIVRECDIFIH